MIVNKWYTTTNKVFESKIPYLEEISLPIGGIIVLSHLLK